MSKMIQCDECKKMMYTDSREDKGAFVSMTADDPLYGYSSFHLCRKCFACDNDNQFKTITNYDRIISKTPKELAEWLWFKVGKCPPFDVCPSQCIPCEAKDCWLDWLKQEAEE